MTNTSVRTQSSFVRRLAGAAALRAATFEEVEADRHANAQALLVVVLSSVAAGFGARGLGAGSLADVAVLTAVALMAWVAWAFVVYVIGSRILPDSQTRVDIGELLRTTGFASAPGMLRILGLWPVLAVPAFGIAAVWMLLAMIVAVRQALEYTTTRRAIAVCVSGWLLAVAIAGIGGFFFGPRVS